MDLVIAMPISWLPLVADYTRFASGPRAAFRGTFWGYLLANIWLYTLGAMLVLGAGASPSPAGIAAGILALAGGSLAGLLFLVGLLVGETDEAFANIYSGALSVQNIFPKLSQKALVVAITLIGAVGAGVLTMELYESFLFLIGSVFVPLFGILVAHHLRRLNVIDGDRGDREEGLGARAYIPWVAGFALYHWITPSPLEAWDGFVRDIVGTPIGERITWLGASVPSFLTALALALLLDRRRSVRPGAVGRSLEA